MNYEVYPAIAAHTSPLDTPSPSYYRLDLKTIYDGQDFHHTVDIYTHNEVRAVADAYKVIHNFILAYIERKELDQERERDPDDFYDEERAQSF